MKTRARISVSVREKAIRQMSVNKKRPESGFESIRVEAQSVTAVSVADGEGDLIDVSFKSPGLWGFMKLSREHAIQFALGILDACEASHLARQEVA